MQRPARPGSPPNSPRMTVPSITAAAARLVVLAVVLLVAALQPAAPGQDGDEPEPKVWPKCLECKTVGYLECPDKLHKKHDLDREHEVAFCSTMQGCETCAGLGRITCPDCERPDVDAELAAEAAALPALVELWSGYGEEMEFELTMVVTEHFELVFELESLKIDKRRKDRHEALHIYAMRLEELYADYLATMTATDKDFRQRLRVFVWQLDSDQKRGSSVFCGSSAPSGVKLLGLNPSYSVCASKRYFKDDEALHRNLVHNVTHLLLSAQQPIGWIGNKKKGWLDAGLAHYFEYRYFELCDNYCYQEQNTNQDFKGGKWKPAVRKLVAADDLPGVGTVFSRNTDNLTLEEHAVAFSYVDYLLFKDAEKFNALQIALHKDVDTRDALMEVFGLTPIGFEVEWKAWVEETYPRR